MNPRMMADLGLDTWHDFYLIVGGAAAGLTGLMFVVVTLAPHVIAARAPKEVRGFVSPTVVFFTTILIVAAVMTIPVITAPAISGILGCAGIGGVVYILVIGTHRMWRDSDLPPQDWLGYVGLPILAYALLCAAAGLLWSYPVAGLSLTGASTIVFLVVGVRNAWDLVLWMAKRSEEVKGARKPDSGAAPD
jgi:hypothetical protein